MDDFYKKSSSVKDSNTTPVTIQRLPHWPGPHRQNIQIQHLLLFNGATSSYSPQMWSHSNTTPVTIQLL